MATHINLTITQLDAQLITDYLRPSALRAPFGHQERLFQLLKQISDGYNVAVATYRHTTDGACCRPVEAAA